jgi:hypothetical protein
VLALSEFKFIERMNQLRDIDWYFVFLIIAVTVAFIGFVTFIIGRVFFGASWFDFAAVLVLTGLGVIVFSLMLMLVQEILEKLKHKTS